MSNHSSNFLYRSFNSEPSLIERYIVGLVVKSGEVSVSCGEGYHTFSTESVRQTFGFSATGHGEQARATHCVLDDSFEVLGRYVQNTCKGKRHPHGMPSDKKIILKIFLSDSWFGFASTLSLAKHSNIFFVTLEEISNCLCLSEVWEITQFSRLRFGNLLISVFFRDMRIVRALNAEPPAFINGSLPGARVHRICEITKLLRDFSLSIFFRLMFLCDLCTHNLY